MPPVFQVGDAIGLGVPLGAVVAHAAGHLARDASLQRFQALVCVFGSGFARVQVAVVRGGSAHLFVREWVAEIEAAQLTLVRAIQDAVLDFEGGDALAARVGLIARLVRRGLEAIFRRNPAIAVADQRDEERAAAPDLVQAEVVNPANASDTDTSAARSTFE